MSVFPVSLLRGTLFDGSGWASAWLGWAPDLLLGLALAGVLAMHVTLKRETAAQAKRSRRMEAMLLRLREASLVAGASASRAHAQTGGGADVEFHSPAFASTGPRPGMNVSRRVQALRLLRRGEDLGHIASALGVPRCEIELLVRVHGLASAAVASETPQPAPAGVRS